MRRPGQALCDLHSPLPNSNDWRNRKSPLEGAKRAARYTEFCCKDFRLKALSCFPPSLNATRKIYWDYSVIPLTRGDWAKRKMPSALPWKKWNCRVQIPVAVNKLKLLRTNQNCPEQIKIALSKTEIAVSKLKFPWVKLKLPWVNWNLPWRFWAWPWGTPSALEKTKLTLQSCSFCFLLASP